MSVVLVALALTLTVAVPTLLVAATGGRALIHTDHDLPRPARTRRAPRRADR